MFFIYLPFLHTALEIYFDERDYSTDEGDTTGLSRISLSFRETQAPFSMKLHVIPITIDVAKTQYNLSDQKARKQSQVHQVCVKL